MLAELIAVGVVVVFVRRRRTELHGEVFGTMGSSVFDGTIGDEPNKVKKAARHTALCFLAGNVVHELTAPDGKVLSMQSCCQIVDSELTISDWENSGSGLDLPRGWTYRAKTLDEDSIQAVSGTTRIPNDDNNSTYQSVR